MKRDSTKNPRSPDPAPAPDPAPPTWTWEQPERFGELFTWTSQGRLRVHVQFSGYALTLAGTDVRRPDPADHLRAAAPFKTAELAQQYVEAHFRPGNPALGLPEDRSDRPVLPLRLISTTDLSTHLMANIECLLEDARGVRYLTSARQFMGEMTPVSEARHLQTLS